MRTSADTMTAGSGAPPTADQLAVVTAHDYTAGQGRGLAFVLLVDRPPRPEMVSEACGWRGEPVIEGRGRVECW